MDAAPSPSHRSRPKRAIARPRAATGVHNHGSHLGVGATPGKRRPGDDRNLAARCGIPQAAAQRPASGLIDEWLDPVAAMVDALGECGAKRVEIDSGEGQMFHAKSLVETRWGVWRESVRQSLRDLRFARCNPTPVPIPFYPGPGSGLVWLRRLFWEQEIGSSNLPSPTITTRHFRSRSA